MSPFLLRPPSTLPESDEEHGPFLLSHEDRCEQQWHTSFWAQTVRSLWSLQHPLVMTLGDERGPRRCKRNSWALPNPYWVCNKEAHFVHDSLRFRFYSLQQHFLCPHLLIQVPIFVDKEKQSCSFRNRTVYWLWDVHMHRMGNGVLLSIRAEVTIVTRPAVTAHREDSRSVLLTFLSSCSEPGQRAIRLSPDVQPPLLVCNSASGVRSLSLFRETLYIHAVMYRVWWG